MKTAGIAAALLVFVFAAFTYPGALAVSMLARIAPPPTASQPAPAGVMPWLHVEHPEGRLPYIADDRGRLVLLHGAVPADVLDFGPSKTWFAAPYPIDPAAYSGEIGRAHV